MNIWHMKKQQILIFSPDIEQKRFTFSLDLVSSIKDIFKGVRARLLPLKVV